jgi:hypothetical protein
MSPILTPGDVRDFLIGFAAAIELDQIRVDALPRERFHPDYCDDLWRKWRRKHLEYIEQLLPTVDALSPSLLVQLAQFAIEYEPADVAEEALGLIGEIVGECCQATETAALFFGCLIAEVSSKSQLKLKGCEARARMMQWIPVGDPLRIAQDSECGYGRPTGSIH